MTTIIHRGAKAKIRCLRNKPGMQPPSFEQEHPARSRRGWSGGCGYLVDAPGARRLMPLSVRAAGSSAPFLSLLANRALERASSSSRVSPRAASNAPASRSPRRGYGGRKKPSHVDPVSRCVYQSFDCLSSLSLPKRHCARRHQPVSTARVHRGPLHARTGQPRWRESEAASCSSRRTVCFRPLKLASSEVGQGVQITRFARPHPARGMPVYNDKPPASRATPTIKAKELSYTLPMFGPAMMCCVYYLGSRHIGWYIMHLATQKPPSPVARPAWRPGHAHSDASLDVPIKLQARTLPRCREGLDLSVACIASKPCALQLDTRTIGMISRTLVVHRDRVSFGLFMTSLSLIKRSARATFNHEILLFTMSDRRTPVYVVLPMRHAVERYQSLASKFNTTSSDLDEPLEHGRLGVQDGRPGRPNHGCDSVSIPPRYSGREEGYLLLWLRATNLMSKMPLSSSLMRPTLTV